MVPEGPSGPSTTLVGLGRLGPVLACPGAAGARFIFRDRSVMSSPPWETISAGAAPAMEVTVRQEPEEEEDSAYRALQRMLEIVAAKARGQSVT